MDEKRCIDHYFKPLREIHAQAIQENKVHTVDNNNIFTQSIKRKFTVLQTTENGSPSIAFKQIENVHNAQAKNVSRTIQAFKVNYKHRSLVTHFF